MAKILTGDKNIDSIILKYLTNEELFKISITGKYGNYLCNYEPFWREKLESRFPYFVSFKGTIKYTSSKNYYLYLTRTICNILVNIDNLNVTQEEVDQHTLENLSQKDKNKALRYASENGCLELVKYLVENKAEINIEHDMPIPDPMWINQNLAKISTLSFASREGHLEVVKYLVQNGADIHIREEQPLLEASRRGHLEVVKYLAENNADIHTFNSGPLARAVEGEHLEMINYLIQKGARIYKYIKYRALRCDPKILKLLSRFPVAD